MMNIALKINGQIENVRLDNKSAALDFLKLLSIELELNDYTSGKLCELSAKPSITGEPVDMKPSIGDIARYAPWQTNGIFYYASEIIKTGHIHKDVSIFKGKESVKILIETCHQH